jgi:hypothetical protein
LDEIMAVILKHRPDYHVVVIADVLIAVPRRLRPMVAQFTFTVRPTI